MNERLSALKEANEKALDLVSAVETAGIITPGKSEREMGEAILEIARTKFGVKRRWHRELVRVGSNTMLTSRERADDRIMRSEDIAFIDLGPVFGDIEADVGRSYYFGVDIEKHRLVSDLSDVFQVLKSSLHSQPDQTGAELFRLAELEAQTRGWVFGGEIAGHIVGEFAHIHWAGRGAEHYIRPENDTPLSAKDNNDRQRYWIIEVHLTNASGEFGGFYEELAS